MQIKIRTLFLLLLFANGIQLAAQDSWEDTLAPKHSVLLRGKAMPGFGIEDWFLFNTSIGAEVRITPKQSVGLDYIALWQWFEKDLWDTVTHEELTYGFSQRDFRHFIHLDYRFYWDPKFAQRKNFSLYTSLYGKTGRARMKSEEGYLFDYGEEIKNEIHFYDAGLSLGIRSGALENNIFGVDFNIGACKRFQRYEGLIYVNQSTQVSLRNLYSNRWMVWCRLNLYYYLN